jgi:hypothetical protein
MSDLRVALVAEGPTDAIIINAALKALLPRPFILTQLQPEPTLPKLGTGWGGVVRWCLEFSSRGHSRLEDDPTLPGFDLFVLHSDADVAESDYANVSPDLATLATQRGWPPLPNHAPCPPPLGSAEAVRACLLSWAGLGGLGPRTVLCVPSKAIDAWLVSALFGEGHALLSGLECNLNLERQLATLPKSERLKKTSRDYRAVEQKVADDWKVVRQRCSEADRFSRDVTAVPVPV